MANQRYPLKDRRLQQLDEAGFNVVDFVCFPPNTLKGRESELQAFLAKHKRISCRHFHEDEKKHFKCPVMYDRDNWDEIIAFCLEHNQKFYTLCNQALTLDDSVYAGNILLLDERNYCIEYFAGKGTPRDIESKGADELIFFRREVGVPMPDDTPAPLKRLAFNFRNFVPDIRPLIIEFSLYPYSVGRQDSNVVCWEWRLGWLHYKTEAVRRLLERDKEHLVTIANLKARIRELEDDGTQVIQRDSQALQ